ncbi:MAG: ATP-dependent zinc metalloprotease FtsH [Porticoccaceae bacterium]
MAKNLILWLVIAAVLMAVFQNLNQSVPANELSYTDFVQQVQNGNVEEVTFQGSMIYGETSDGSSFQSVRPNVTDNQIMDELLRNGVNVRGEPPKEPSIFMQLLVASFPILIIIAVFAFFMRQMQGGAGGRGGPMSFGKSKARLLGENQIKITFGDVAGIDEAKEDLQELVQYLRDPAKFQRLGGEIPRGVLMVGPPGTGKTLMAKAIAGEAKVPFFSISGSDFVEMFVGVGASRVRDMFEQAKKQAPCIIFIDEIDAVGRHRGGGYGGGNDEREQTLNQMLVEMDGFEGNEGVIVIAATNRPDVLDRALLRPGRFDRQVYVSLPDIRGREQILEVHLGKVPTDESVKTAVIARSTPGFSGADLANLVNEAALIAARRNKRVVTGEDFEYARDKIMMGAERRSMVMSEKDKINTAYHEAGHAIVGYLMPEHDPIHKVTIIPRGRALGVTMYLPEEDKYSSSRRALKSSLCSLFGGRIAEELIGGSDAVTTGASNDIERATQLARNMVTKWGLSDLGPIHYGEERDEASNTAKLNYSPETSDLIDKEARKILDECYEIARKILEDNIDILHAMKDALMEYETIDSEQVGDLMARKKVRPPKGWDGGAGGTPNKNTEPQSDDKTDATIVGGPANQH